MGKRRHDASPADFRRPTPPTRALSSAVVPRPEATILRNRGTFNDGPAMARLQKPRKAPDGLPPCKGHTANSLLPSRLVQKLLVAHGSALALRFLGSANRRPDSRYLARSE